MGLVRGNTDVVAGTILDGNGEPISKPTHLLSADDARVLREYKKFLQRYGIREAVYCNECFSGNLSDGMRAHVTDGQILFECRHRMLFYQGQTF